MTRTNLDELESLATAMSAADARLMEIGEGVGGLGIRHPEMLEDWRAWQDSSENSHADTVLGLIAELRAERKRADEAIESLDARWEHSDHTAAKYYRRMREAERALADFEKAHTPTDDERENRLEYVIDAAVPVDDFPAWRFRYSMRIADAVRAAGFRRSEVPEPSVEDGCRMCARSDGPEHSRPCHFGEHTGCEGLAEGSDSTPCGCPCHQPEPQGEPSGGHDWSGRAQCRRCGAWLLNTNLWGGECEAKAPEPQGEPSDAQGIIARALMDSARMDTFNAWELASDLVAALRAAGDVR